MPRQSSVRPRSKGQTGIGCSAMAPSKAAERLEVSGSGVQQPATPSTPSVAAGTPQLARVALVVLEVDARLLELAQRDERLDRVRP